MSIELFHNLFKDKYLVKRFGLHLFLFLLFTLTSFYVDIKYESFLHRKKKNKLKINCCVVTHKSYTSVFVIHVND